MIKRVVPKFLSVCINECTVIPATVLKFKEKIL